jgi:PPE-repeat protein
MFDFGASPPEVTSAKMYSGPGSASMTSAAAAWNAVAAELNSFAQGYSSVISQLEGQQWSGPAATAMAAAAAPYVQWASTAATQAEQTASQAQATAAAFEAAHGMVVPPPLIAANRSQLMQLIQTNLLGQNTPQIAATEAQYEQMWAQDSQAMYGYATSASTATKLTPFTAPPQTANPAGQANQAATTAAQAAGAGASHLNSLSQMISSVPQQLSSAASPAAAATTSSTTSFFGIQLPNSFLSDIGTFNTMAGPVNTVAALARTFGNLGTYGVASFRVLNDMALYSPLLGLTQVAPGVAFGTGALGAGLAGATTAGSNAVLASAGAAAPLGPLSVPPSWASATPIATAASEQPLWISEAEALHEADAEAGAAPAAGFGPMAGVAGAAAAGMLARPVVSNMLRVAPRRFKMPRPTSGG